MKVLHICNGFVGSKVHTQLYQRLDNVVDCQTIYSAIYPSDKGRNTFCADHTRIVLAPILRQFYRPLYHVKKWVMTRSICHNVNVSEYDCIHAVTLFTDGVQAYEMYRRYGKPYILAVRNTDLNLFLEKCPYAWGLGKKALLNASKIVFISKAMMESFARHKVIAPIVDKIQDKFICIPNGVDEYWHNHIEHSMKLGKNVLYVGDFSLNKNVARVIEAVANLSKEPGYENIHLNLVGGGKSRNSIKGAGQKGNDLVLELIEKNKELITFHGPIYNKDKLREEYAANDVFVMPSHHETFGLVYIEALSQNLPVVYTKGQGIDGLFGAEVGIGVNPMSVDEIKDAIKCILDNRKNYSNEKVDFSWFDWKHIAGRYKAIYEQVIRNK